MDQQYPQNASENDYVDQVWLPVLKSLFAINGNIIRLKKGETTTEESRTTYTATIKILFLSRLISDLFMIIMNMNFDIGAIEACLPQADDEKVTDDESKLHRE